MFDIDVTRIISLRDFKSNEFARNLTKIFEDLDNFNYDGKHSVCMALSLTIDPIKFRDYYKIYNAKIAYINTFKGTADCHRRSTLIGILYVLIYSL